MHVKGIQDWDLGPLPVRRSSLPSVIAAALGARIRSGEFPAGTRLPSEPQLASSLKVSRNTVREAISVLREQGLAVTRQGNGTFTVDPNIETQFPVGVGIEHLTSTTEMITNAGHKAGCREFGLVTGSGSTFARQQLRVDHEEQLHSIERVRTADNLPAILCRDYISTTRVPTKVIAQFRGDESLFLFLQRECHLKVKSARADIVPLMPSPRVAELLAVSSRKPLLELKQLHFDGDGTPFLYSENVFNPEYMDLHVRRTPVS